MILRKIIDYARFISRPLPVLDNIQTEVDRNSKETIIYWEPNPDSYQDEYKITYLELENAFNGDSSSVYVQDTSFSLQSLQPGRNYSISISAVAGSSDVSQEVESNKRTIYQATRKILFQSLKWQLKIIYIFRAYQYSSKNLNEDGDTSFASLPLYLSSVSVLPT